MRSTSCRRSWKSLLPVYASMAGTNNHEYVFRVIEPVANLALPDALRGSLGGWSKTLARKVAADGVTVNIVIPDSSPPPHPISGSSQSGPFAATSAMGWSVFIRDSYGTVIQP
jgi:NAD(P)-dependent dehydrogenase (short-subunit alcohol dehydrogenase family)